MEKIEKYDRVIDEVYENYKTEIIRQRELQKNEVERLRRQGKRIKVILIELLSKEDFIRKIKTDNEFSQKWGIQIEERELATKERMNLCEKYWKQHNLFPLLWRVDGGGFMYDEIEKTIDRTCWNIPTKVITLIYQNKTITHYE